MKIHLVGAQLLHADGQTDRHDETVVRFSQSSEHPNIHSDEDIEGLRWLQ